MSSQKIKQFKQKIQENRGISIDGRKIYGKVKTFDPNKIEVYGKNKIICVDIKSPDIPIRDKLDLKVQCKSLLPIIDQYNVDEKILLSNVTNTIFDIKLDAKTSCGDKTIYNFITV